MSMHDGHRAIDSSDIRVRWCGAVLSEFGVVTGFVYTLYGCVLCVLCA